MANQTWLCGAGQWCVDNARKSQAFEKRLYLRAF